MNQLNKRMLKINTYSYYNSQHEALANLSMLTTQLEHLHTIIHYNNHTLHNKRNYSCTDS